MDDLLSHPEVPEVTDGVPAYKIHPLVGHVLTKMDGDIRDLEAAKGLADKDQEKLGVVSAEAAAHMSEGVTLKRSIIKTQAAEKTLEKKFETLRREEARIEKNKEKLHRTLTHVMEPKIRAAENRLAAKKKTVRKMKDTYATWFNKRDEYKKHAMEELQARKDAADSLKAADEALADAQKEENIARERYERKRRLAGEGVQQYRYVETRFQGASSQLKEVEPEIVREEKGIDKMRKVLNLEAKRIEDAEVRQKLQLKRVLDGIEKQHEGKDREMFFLHKRYSDWQHAEQDRAAVVAQRKEAYRQADAAYKEKRSEVYKKAEGNAVSKANKDADFDWGDWAWSGDGMSDPQDEQVHLTEQ